VSPSSRFSTIIPGWTKRTSTHVLRTPTPSLPMTA